MTLTKRFNKLFGGDWWWDAMRCWRDQDSERVIRKEKTKYGQIKFWMHEGSDLKQISVKESRRLCIKKY